MDQPLVCIIEDSFYLESHFESKVSQVLCRVGILTLVGVNGYIWVRFGSKHQNTAYHVPPDDYVKECGAYEPDIGIYFAQPVDIKPGHRSGK